MATKIKHEEIVIGLPLRADVRDRDRVLLARAGWVVESERERDLLLGREAYWVNSTPALAPDSESDRLPLQGARPQRVYEFLNYRLDRVCREIDALPAFESYLLDLVKVIRDSLLRHHDALLAQVLLGRYPRYSIRHSIDTAILVEAMGLQGSYPVSARNASVCAAFTMNLSMLQMQDRLQDLAGELPDAVLQTMREHPKRSVGMLIKAGIKNEAWLTAVLHHHERLDGSGYPAGLRDVSITTESQLVAAADVILARMSPAAYRAAETPAKAFWAAYETRGTQLRQDVLTLAVKVMGLYPPGTLVRLANHDLAVVTSRGSHIGHPMAKVILGERGLVPISPQERDTSHDDYTVVSVVDPARAGVQINQDVLWPD